MSLLLAFVVAAMPGVAETVEEGRGKPGGDPELVQTLRQRTRGRLGISAFGNLAFFAEPAAAVGPGLSIEGGMVVTDRWSVLLRSELSLGTDFFLANGLGFAFAATERFQIGLGLSFTIFTPLFFGGAGGRMSPFVGLTLPVTAQLFLGERGPGEVGRAGFTLGLQLSPGLSFTPRYGFDPFTFQPYTPLAFAASVLVGYTFW